MMLNWSYPAANLVITSGVEPESGNIFNKRVGVDVGVEISKKVGVGDGVRVGISKKVEVGAESALPRMRESESELNFLFELSD